MATSILLGIGSALGLAALYVTDPVLIYDAYVPTLVEYQGYKGELLSKMLRERIREITLEAGTGYNYSLAEFNAHESTIDTLAEQLHIDTVIDGLREFLGLHQYNIQPYLATSGRGLRFIAKDTATDHHLAYNANLFRLGMKGESADGQLFYIETDPGDDIQALIQELAIKFIERVNPYVLALYYFRQEYEQGEFTRTLPIIEHGMMVLPHEMKAWPLELRGEIYARRGQYDEAIRIYYESLKIDPTYYADTMAVWGKALIAKGHTEDGLRLMHQAVSASANDPDQHSVYWPTVHVYLGDALANLSCPNSHQYYCVQVDPDTQPSDPARDAEARDIYVQGLELVPDNPYLKTSLAALYIRHHQLSAAITLLQEAIQNHPQRSLARQLLDQALARKNAQETNI